MAFGSNIGDPQAQIRLAWQSLQNEPTIEIVACSRLYRNAPVGGSAGQPDYVNAVCRARTDCSARDVLNLCLDVERRLGRVRQERWGPRTIDIDLVLDGDRTIRYPAVHVPHPRLRERLFVLVPLAEAAPEGLKLPPDGKPLSVVLESALRAAGETIDDWERRVVE